MRHIVALSGGKDSTALALALAEREPRDYEFICTPTGDELPEMIRHWEKIGSLLGKPLVHVRAPVDLHELIDQYKALPNFRMRWCTRVLKIIPYSHYLHEATPCVSYVGLRADEESRKGGLFDDVPGVETRYPLREWGWREIDVIEYLHRRDIEIPSRTDCARCFHQRIGEWWDLWRDYPEIYQHAVDQEERHGHTFRTDERDTWPTALADLRVKFEVGKIPLGASVQLELFDSGFSKCRVCSL